MGDMSHREADAVTKLAETLKRDLGAVSVTLYGSAARHALTDGSDIDVLIVFGKVDWELEKRVCDLCYQVELDIGRVVSSLCVTQHELADTPLRATPLMRHVRQEGVLL